MALFQGLRVPDDVSVRIGQDIVKGDELVMSHRYRSNAPISSPSQGSAVFNGTTDYIQLHDSFSYTNHTIAAWVYVNDTATNKEIFDSRTGAGNGILLFATTTETINYRLNGLAGIDSVATYPNKWIFVSATYDGATQKLYIDGSLIVSQAIVTSIVTTQNAFLGRYTATATNYMDGNLANVAIWNRALTSDEINSVMWKQYEELSLDESNGLQAWYSLDSTEVFSDWYAYSQYEGAVIEGRTCVDNALNALAQL